MANSLVRSLAILAIAALAVRAGKMPRPLGSIRNRPPFPKRRPRKDGLADGVPVDPNRPGSLDGGAALALEFDT